MFIIKTKQKKYWNSYITWLDGRSVTSETLVEYVNYLEQLRARDLVSIKVINSFLDEAKELSPTNVKVPNRILTEKTGQSYERYWNNFLSWLGDRPVTSKNIADYVTFLREQDYGKATINAFIVAASNFVERYVELPAKERVSNSRRRPRLTPIELDFFKKGISQLTPNQQEDIHRLLRGEKPMRFYASIYMLVQRVGLLTLGRAITPNQIKGLEFNETNS